MDLGHLQRILTGDTAPLRVPHDHSLSLGRYHRAEAALTGAVHGTTVRFRFR